MEPGLVGCKKAESQRRRWRSLLQDGLRQRRRPQPVPLPRQRFEAARKGALKAHEHRRSRLLDYGPITRVGIPGRLPTFTNIGFSLC